MWSPIDYECFRRNLNIPCPLPHYFSLPLILSATHMDPYGYLTTCYVPRTLGLRLTAMARRECWWASEKTAEPKHSTSLNGNLMRERSEQWSANSDRSTRENGKTISEASWNSFSSWFPNMEHMMRSNLLQLQTQQNQKISCISSPCPFIRFRKSLESNICLSYMFLPYMSSYRCW